MFSRVSTFFQRLQVHSTSPRPIVSPELQQLLRDTSRSFYLTLRILPAPVRPQIGLAYLLARASDTIADTELVPWEGRLEALEAFQQRIQGSRSDPVDLRPLLGPASSGHSDAERKLLEQLESALALLPGQSEEDQRDIRAVLATITAGQALDLRRFGSVSPQNPGSLHHNAELDDYTYRVAGCVGEFWTRLTRRHCFPSAPLREDQFLNDGIRFGKGLQLINILRDLPRDLRLGRCYFPASSLAAVGLTPRDLLDPTQEFRFRPIYDEWLALAQDHLAAGWRYTNTIPKGHARLRLACAWPILIGARTLVKLRQGRVLAADGRIKVGRKEVRSILLGTLLRLPFHGPWEAQFQNALSSFHRD